MSTHEDLEADARHELELDAQYDEHETHETPFEGCWLCERDVDEAREDAAKILDRFERALDRAPRTGSHASTESGQAALTELLLAGLELARSLGRRPIAPYYGEGQMSDRDAMREAGRTR